jgi:uncharacterized protein
MKLSFRSVLVPIAAALVGVAFRALNVPAAWFFGPLAVSALVAICGWHETDVPRPIYLAAQAVIGTALGAGIGQGSLQIFASHIVTFVLCVASLLLISVLNAWILFRFARLDAATALLGSLPGSATEMAALSDSLRADARLVTVMQSLRVLLIVLCLAIVTPILSSFDSRAVNHEPPITAPVFAATFAWWKLGILAVLAYIGWLTGMRTRIPAGTLLIPALLYFILQIGGVELGRLPWPVTAVAYLVAGLSVGGRFRRSTIIAAKQLLLPLFATTLLLFCTSFILAYVLVRQTGLDAVSAFLAATPGILESVGAVAAEVQGDSTMILSVHILRLACVVIAAPWLVRAARKWLVKRGQSRA